MGQNFTVLPYKFIKNFLRFIRHSGLAVKQMPEKHISDTCLNAKTYDCITKKKKKKTEEENV